MALSLARGHLAPAHPEARPNSAQVGFYQIAKLLLAPFVCVVESVYFGKRFSINVVLSIFAVLVGVGIVTVSDVESNALGVIMAVIFIVSSGFQQIL